MVCMLLCGLVWFSIVHYANVCPCNVSNGLVWLMVMYGLVWPYAAIYNFCACFQVCPKNEVAQKCPNNLRESQVPL